MFDIITIGGATRDVFLFTEELHSHKTKDAATRVEACLPFGAKINIEEIHYDTGGGATNAAVTFSRLGKLRTGVLTRIGNDSRGISVRNALRADHVDTTLLQVTSKEHTAYSAILSPANMKGERTIMVYRGASKHFEHGKIPWNKLKAKWFYISSLGGDIALLKKIVAHAQRIGAKIMFNPGSAELIKLSPTLKVRGGWEGLWQSLTFLLLNREEAVTLTGIRSEDTKELLRALMKITPSAIMTDGPKGAYAVYKGTGYYVPSVGHAPKNLTGAGDAFGSGFVTGWIKSNGDIKEALRVGSFNADSVVQHIGAKTGILRTYPTKKQLATLAVKEIKL